MTASLCQAAKLIEVGITQYPTAQSAEDPRSARTTVLALGRKGPYAQRRRTPRRRSSVVPPGSGDRQPIAAGRYRQLRTAAGDAPARQPGLVRTEAGNRDEGDWKPVRPVAELWQAGQASARRAVVPQAGETPPHAPCQQPPATVLAEATWTKARPALAEPDHRLDRFDSDVRAANARVMRLSTMALIALGDWPVTKDMDSSCCSEGAMSQPPV